MRRDLCNALLQRHRRIFANPEGHGDAAGDLETRVGDGWYTLLDVLCTDLQYETDQQGAPQVHATQIKEKFGRLRFRVDHASDRHRAMIRLAESLSERSCEECGAPAEDLSILEHAPRCEQHLSQALPSSDDGLPTIFARLRQFFLRRLIGQRMKTSRKTNLQATMDLYEAIRYEDVDAVRDALARGPSLRGLAKYPDGCYRPIELARKVGNPRVIALLETHNNSNLMTLERRE